jgi:hypothetical protein
MCRYSCAHPFIDPKPHASGQRPLLTLPLNTVHIHDVWFAAKPVPKVEASRVVTKSQDDALFIEGMSNSLPIKDYRADRSLPGGDVHTPYIVPSIFTERLLGTYLAIHGHSMATVAKEESQILRKRLEPAVFGWYATRSQDKNMHLI